MAKVETWGGLLFQTQGEIGNQTIAGGSGAFGAGIVPNGNAYDDGSAPGRRCFALIGMAFTFPSGSPTLNQVLEVYFLYEDNYTYTDNVFTDGGAAIDPPVPPVAVIPVRAITTVQVAHVHGIRIYPTNFKVLLKNRTNQPLSGYSSGSILRLQTYCREIL
jgi:hypothetical protein